MATLRSRLNRKTTGIVAGIGVAGLLAGAAIAGSSDPGADYHDLLSARSQPLFGFGHPLDAGVAGAFDGPGDEAVELAKGLKATLVTDAVGRRADMIALWPDDAHPTHAIICNEIDTANPNAGGSPNPDFGKATVQRVRLSDGAGHRHDDRPQRVRPGAPDGLGHHPRRRGERRNGSPVGDPRPAQCRRRDRQSGRRDDQRSRPRRRSPGPRPAQLRGRRRRCRTARPTTATSCDPRTAASAAACSSSCRRRRGRAATRSRASTSRRWPPGASRSSASRRRTGTSTTRARARTPAPVAGCR